MHKLGATLSLHYHCGVSAVVVALRSTLMKRDSRGKLTMESNKQVGQSFLMFDLYFRCLTFLTPLQAIIRRDSEHFSSADGTE